MNAFVELRQVWLAYKKDLFAQGVFAVEDISLQVAAGAFIAIVGPSGCGKSTFMKLATGLKKPSRRTILIDGAPVAGPLKISGMSFQAPNLLPWRTTLDNVLLPLEIVEPYRWNFRRKRAEYADKARALLASLGLGRLRRQVSVAAVGRYAAACQHLPRAVPRAEDAAARRTVRRARRLHPRGAVERDARLQSAQQFNVILVTHDLRESVFLADTVDAMSKGPGRIMIRRDIDLPRPRDIELTYAREFIDIVHELRGHIGAVRGGSVGTAPAKAAQGAAS